MSIDKTYCMSSYLAFRYIEDDEKDFFKGMRHRKMPPVQEGYKTLVRTAAEIDSAIQAAFDREEGERLGLLLSGGMDSAILASYMRGADAYTFRFLGGGFQEAELHRAESYAQYYGLKLHYVDIDWNQTVVTHLDPVLKAKAAPVHSIEPQIRQAAMQAKQDGVTMMVVGESSDLKFGGMDQLLSKDWTVVDFTRRYTFTEPASVLKEPVEMSYLFERYRLKNDKMDFLRFMDDIFSIESSNSYFNAFSSAGMRYIDPYAHLHMAEPLDLGRIRRGESKYLIRELFSMKYPGVSVPEKVPMPRPVDFYFRDWAGPTRPEFKSGLDMSRFTGNQKWQIWCLEHFLNLFDPHNR